MRQGRELFLITTTDGSRDVLAFTNADSNDTVPNLCVFLLPEASLDDSGCLSNV